MSERVSLHIIRGGLFVENVFWQDKMGSPINMEGFTFKMHIRKRYDSATYLVELSTENGRITTDPSEGLVQLFLDEPTVNTLPVGTFVYDLEYVDSLGYTKKFLRGLVSVQDEKTR